MPEDQKILVVEDNDFVRMQIVKILQDEGYGILEAPDGQVALNAIDNSVVMCVVDVRMSPMDGFEFIKALQRAENNTPVVLVTGDDNPDLLRNASNLNVAAVLMKPVQRDRLVKIVSRTLASKSKAS